MHTPNGAGDHIEKMVGRVGMAGETRLVKLNEIDARRNESHELGVDDRNQGLGHGVAIGVDLAPVDAASQCEWPGNRHLYRPPGILPEPVVFRDSSQTVGSRQRLQAAEPLTLVVRRGTPVAGTTNWRQAAQVLVKAEVEIDPLHLAIGDAIEPRPQLVVNGQPDGVANRLLPIYRAEKVGMRAHIADELFIPARK